jgi:hypothetical protein
VSSPNKRSLALAVVTVALLALGAAFILRYGAAATYRAPGWALAAAKLKLSLEQDPSAGAYYDRTGAGPLPLAAIAKDLRGAWPDQSVAVVHQAALEVGTALLHRANIEMGEWVDGRFVPSVSAPWDDNQRMISEVMASPVLFENERVYVFHRK